jgi:hypothetical protein
MSDTPTPTFSPTGTFTPIPTLRNNTTNVTVDPNMQVATFAVAIALRTSIIVISLVAILLCFMLRNKQPVQSRLFVPYIFVFTKIIYSIAVILSTLPQAYIGSDSFTSTQISCWLSLWGTNPLYFADVASIVFMFLRFFVLRAQSNRQEHIIQGRRELLETESTHIKRDRRGTFFRILIHPAFLAVALFICILSIYVVGGIDAGNAKGICSDRWSKSEKQVTDKYPDIGYKDAHMARYQVVIFILIAITAVIMIITDLVINGHFKRCGREFFQVVFEDDDPLVFRFELYAFILSAIPLGLIFVIYGIITAAQSANTYDLLIKTILYFFFWDLPSLAAIPGVIIYKAIRWETRRGKSFFSGWESSNFAFEEIESAAKAERMKTKDMDIRVYDSSMNMIHRLLGTGDKEAHKLFQEFCNKEFSVENILCYDDMTSYQDADSDKKRLLLANHIFENYLSQNAPYEVNVQRPQIEEIRKALKELETDPNAKLDDKLFDVLLRGIILNLLDSYSRFFYTKPFQDYIETKKKKKGILAIDESKIQL